MDELKWLLRDLTRLLGADRFTSGEIVDQMAGILAEEYLKQHDQLAPDLRELRDKARQAQKLDNPDEMRVVLELLRRAEELAGGPGPLFNRFILFLDERRADSPTPRHLAEAMAQLVRVEPGERLGDLACGTGGLLVTGRPDQTVSRIGIEISHRSALFARLNLALNGFSSAEIHEQDALDPEHRYWEPRRFEPMDAIVMNPPFGNRQFPYRYEDQLVRRNDTAFMLAALNLLKPTGRAAILSTQAPLFVKSKAEWQLRNRLLQQGLRAVVTLPQGISPSPNLPLALWYIRRGREGLYQSDLLWLLDASQDGLSRVRRRDPFAELDPVTDDLQLLPAICGPEQDRTQSYSLGRYVKVRPIPDAVRPRGYVFDVTNPALVIGSVETFPPTEKGQGPVLVTVVHPHDRSVAEVVGLHDEPVAQPRQDLLSRAYRGRKKSELPEPDRVYRPRVPVGAVALLLDSRVLGIAVRMPEASEMLNEDLRPQAYLQETPVAERDMPPEEILVSIRQNQRLLNESLDRLFSRAQLQPVSKESLPPELARDQYQKPLEPIGTLSPDQRAIWNAILQEEWDRRLLPFNSASLSHLAKPQDHVDQTLDLYRRMGALMFITIEGKEAYRSVTTLDLWDWRQDLEETVEDSRA